MGLKRPAGDVGGGGGGGGGGGVSDSGDEGPSSAKVANLIRLEKESRDHAKANPKTSASAATAAASSTSRVMQGQSKDAGLHSIDSDDEEDYVKRNEIEALDVDEEVDGVEESTIDRDGEIQITAFNLREDEEDGHFDKDGNFVWKKKGEEIRDSWLDGVDWGKVKERSAEEVKRREREDEAEDEAEAAYDETDCYRQMARLMKPRESVAKALQRLGGGKKSSAQRLKEKKRIKEGKETEEEKANRENLSKLTGLADAVLSRSGHMEIYQETYESIAYKIKQADGEKKTAAASTSKPAIPEGTDDDDALDMFMESSKGDGEKEKEKEKSKDEAAAENKMDLSDDVQWEFRWENADSAEVHGPHGTSEMIKWQESGFFDNGVFVRKLGSKDFYDVKRVDFDLYT